MVARLNGKAIYEDQLTQNVQKSLRKFKKYGMRKDSTDLVKRLKKKALSKVIDNELIYQESRKLKIGDLDKKVEQQFQTERRKHKTEHQFKSYLKMKNLTVEGLRESLRKKILVNEYLKKNGISEPEISEDLLKRFYNDNPNSYYRDEAVKVSHILIKVPWEATREERKNALEKAEMVHREILDGRDFAEMAKKYSDCNSASGGGNLNYIKRGYMPEEFDKTAFAMKKNAVSNVVETKFGYHIIKVFDKTPEGPAPYNEVKGFIRKYFQGQESKKRLASHIAELKKKAKIEILLDEAQK